MVPGLSFVPRVLIWSAALRSALDFSQSWFYFFFQSTLGSKSKALIFSLSPLPGREPLPSLSAGMSAHVEMLARLHVPTKFSHTKGKETEGGGKSGMKDRAASRSKATATPPANPTSELYKDLPATLKLFSRNLSTANRWSGPPHGFNFFVCLQICPTTENPLSHYLFTFS